MRKLVIALAALLALPVAAQNTDIEALAGLQFNFGNPGARALGMGGAFLGLADDASAAEANPAGLTILRKAEVSIEARNFLEQQVFTTGGTFPDLIRTPFTHHSNRAVVSFASVVYPFSKVTVGAYFHEPLRNTGGGAVFPQVDEFTGEETPLPNFYLPTDGAPVSREECQRIVRETNNPFACLEYRIDPFVSALSVRQQTYGLAAGWQVHPKFSVGATARYQRLNESAATFRFKPFFDATGNIVYLLDSISYQATAEVSDAGEIVQKPQSDVTFGAGFKWSPTDRISIGGVYKQGGSFDAPLFFAGSQTGGEIVNVAVPKFHIPDVAGLGISVRPIPVLTINLDAVHVKYSNLVDDFVSLAANVQDLEEPYKANDVVELRLGAEYFFSTRIPFAVRAGFWRDPAHSVEYQGPLNHPQFVAEAMLFPKGEAQNHVTVGVGFAWPRFQIDAAYDSSDRYKVGSISMVTRF